MNRFAFSLVLIAAMASMSAYAQRAPAEPPPEGTAEVEAPMPEVGNPTELSDEYLRDYGLSTRPDPSITTTEPTIRDPSTGQMVPNPNNDWNAAAENYQSGATSGDVDTPPPDPPTPTPAPTPAYQFATYNSDCKFVARCYAETVANPSAAPTSVSSFISFTVPYTAYRSGMPCPGGHHFSIWVGVEVGGSRLWQAGLTFTAQYNDVCQYVDGSYLAGPFWEEYPFSVGSVGNFPNVSAKPGDRVYVSIWNVPGTRTLKAQFTNLTTAQSAIVAYEATHDITLSRFSWSIENHDIMPHIGDIQICGIATDNNSKMYRAGDITNSNVDYWNMTNTNYPATPMWGLIHNVTPGCFYVDTTK